MRDMVSRIAETRNVYKILIRYPTGKRNLGVDGTIILKRISNEEGVKNME